MNLKPEEVFLAQGTLRPDLIESASVVASGKAEVIKTHHNDTELIRKLREEVSSERGYGAASHLSDFRRGQLNAASAKGGTLFSFLPTFLLV